MNFPHRLWISILAAALSINVASAKETGDALKWLTPAQETALSDTVPPPPEPGWAPDKADLADVVAAQKIRTPATVRKCITYQHYSYLLFATAYGADLTEEKYPKFIQLLKNVTALTHAVNDAAKSKYKRPRPYMGHPHVVHPVFTVDGYSYPSGHSMGSYTLALVLGAVFPDKAQAFLEHAAKIAQSRVNAGVHYPSDIREGEVLGKATGAAILASPAFQADLAEVRAELKK